MKCDTCRKNKECVELCDDMESILPKEMRFEEIPIGGINDMENIIQRYIEESNSTVIKREINKDLFKIGIELLNKLTIHQHVILYLSHVAGMNDNKIAFFFRTNRSNIYHSRKSAYKKLRRLKNEHAGVV